MKFSALISALLMAFGSCAAFAGEAKSPKKAEADAVAGTMTAPQVIEPGDNSIGMRVSQGDVFDSKPLAGVIFEHMVTPNFGVGGQFHYAQYDQTITVGGLKGTWDYKAYVFVVHGSFHFDVFKVKNLDTYITAGVGHTNLKSSWSSNANLPDSSAEAKGSSTYLLAYATARYFINSQWGLTASLGTPIGTLALGFDYLF